MDDTTFAALQDADENAAIQILEDFNNKHAESFAFTDFPIEQRKALVDHIFTKLSSGWKSNVPLEALRILSRDKQFLEQLFPTSHLASLAQLAGLLYPGVPDDANDPDTVPIILEAQKILCNLIYNNTMIQRICSANGTVEGIMTRLRMYKEPGVPNEVKKFDMRMLFLLTALCADIRPKLRIQWHGLTYLMEVLDLILKSNMEHHRAKGKKRFSRNSRHGKDRGGGSPHIMVPCLLDAEVELACEVLKVLFNLTVNLDHRTLDEPEEAHFLRLASILHDTLLCNTRSPDKKLLLHSYTVDLLTVMPDSAYEELLTPLTDLPIGSDDAEFDFEGMNMEAVIVLVEFLEFRLSTKPERGLKEWLSPILTVLAEISRANRIIRKFLKIRILPPLKDVMNKPEDGNTLRNRLVRLLTSADVCIKELVAELLFILCKEKVSRLIKYTGYGNAAGLLANRGMMLGGSTGRYSSESEDTDTEEYRQYKEDINPVVGCYQPPGPNPMEGLTEEQKEYEAMQLVNVLDKMTMQNSCVRPMTIGPDGKPHAIEHVFEFQAKVTDPEPVDSD